jgi:hypothetical protein
MRSGASGQVAGPVERDNCLTSPRGTANPSRTIKRARCELRLVRV